MNGSKAMRISGKSWIIGATLMPLLSVAIVESTPVPDMDLVEILGSLDTKDNSGKEVLKAIDTDLLPDLPEEPPYDNVK